MEKTDLKNLARFPFEECQVLALKRWDWFKQMRQSRGNVIIINVLGRNFLPDQSCHIGLFGCHEGIIYTHHVQVKI